MRLTSSSHVLTRPDWLEADERDLHGQYEAHNVESAVSCREENSGETGKIIKIKRH